MARLIDADALKKQWSMADKCEDCPQDARICQFAQDFTRMDICEMIDEAQTIGGWISVKDRLPDKSGTYLMYTESGDVFSAGYDSCADDDCCFGWWQEYFDGETLGCVGGEFEPVHGITHWMPLPEPPEEVTV